MLDRAIKARDKELSNEIAEAQAEEQGYLQLASELAGSPVDPMGNHTDSMDSDSLVESQSDIDFPVLSASDSEPETERPLTPSGQGRAPGPGKARP